MICSRRAGGFTVLEIVIALAILSILVVAAVPVVRLDMQRQREAELREDLRELRNAIDAYKRAVDDGRIPRATEASGYPRVLEDLVKGVADAKDPKARPMYFLRRIPRDPFSDRPDLLPSETWGLRSYESGPSDPSPGDDVYDVYSLASGSGINGVPYRQW
jgi:general secretion pathway protein G